MFQQHGGSKKIFTIESLVGKEAGGGSSGDEPIRPTALRFPDSLHPAAAAAAAAATAGFGSRFPAAPEHHLLLQQLQEAPSPGGMHPLHPLHLGGPHSLFGPQQQQQQHRDPLSFYPGWLLRGRYLGHRYQGEPADRRQPLTHPSLKPW